MAEEKKCASCGSLKSKDWVKYDNNYYCSKGCAQKAAEGKGVCEFC